MPKGPPEEPTRPIKGSGFVAQVVKDPKNPPKTLLLAGFLGDAAEEGHTRLYLDPQLSSYVDIPNDGVLYSQEVPGGGDLNPSYLWIASDAKLIPAGSGGAHGSSQTHPSQGEKNVNTTVPHSFAPPCTVAIPTLVPPTCHPLLCGQHGGAAGAQAQFGIPSVPVSQCLTIPIVCCPLAAQAAPGAQAAAPQTAFPTLLPPTCHPLLCGQQGGAAGAQAQFGIPSVPVSQCLTIPIVCCPLAAQAAPGAQGAQAAPQTVYQTCHPGACGQQGGAAGAQAQFGIPSVPVSQCLTIPIVCC
jgi:hypothetical protein